MQILHLLYFNNPIGIKSSGPFQIHLEEWEVENKSFFMEKKYQGGGSILPCVQQMFLKGNFN